MEGLQRQHVLGCQKKKMAATHLIYIKLNDLHDMHIGTNTGIIISYICWKENISLKWNTSHWFKPFFVFFYLK